MSIKKPIRRLSSMTRVLNSLLREDKPKHIVVSAIIMVALNLFLPWWVAACVTFAIGVGKEVYDKVSGKGCAEWKDLLADCVGILIGIL